MSQLVQNRKMVQSWNKYILGKILLFLKCYINDIEIDNITQEIIIK